ncbi:efflux RND transporter periplasmic adaptor subunit [Lonsdalea quercina]|uniref:efflux RND transporter periplasmic adaptor subunit n=1 Tax=Lonsdalea quercina TaxID=71657 RepID=UPI0039758B80
MIKKFLQAILNIFHRRIPVTVMVLSAILVTTWLFMSKYNNKPTPKQQAEWMLVQPQAIEQQLGLVGRIQAERQIILSAPFEGLIRDVRVREGEFIKAGQTLVQLDPGLLGIQLRQAEAELIKSKREVHQLDKWSSSPDVSRARRAELSARSALTATQANLRDTRALFKRGIVPRMEVDALVQQELTQQQDLLSAQDDLRDVKARGTGEERKIAEMGLLNAQVRYQTLEEQSKKQTINAPFDGIAVRPDVTEGGKAVFAQQGMQVSQGTPLITVIGLDRLQVLTQVNESDLYLLREGMLVKITGDGFTGQILDGHISAISVQSDSPDGGGTSARYNVVASIDSLKSHSAQQIRLGMSARVAVILYRNEKAIIVPPDAIHEEGDSAWVWYRTSPDAEVSKHIIVRGKTVTQGIEIHGVEGGYVMVSGQ